MSEEKKANSKKSEADKKREKDQLINLWMNNLESDDDQAESESSSAEKAAD